MNILKRLLALAALTLPFIALPSAQAEVKSGPVPALRPGGQWFNSRPLTLEQLKGKVVLVNLWVYSCVNCHNSLPTLKDWYAKYAAQGLEIVGVHTPEFESDKDPASVRADLLENGVTWPVVQDNASQTWRAFENQFWPAFYFVDRKGKVRSFHAGEISSRFPGAIPGLEAQIKALLAEKP